MNFKQMRLKKQELSREESINLLKSAKQGVLAINGENGYPYTIPLNYAYEDGKIFIHGALKGGKIESLLANPKVSFTVIGKDTVIKEDYATDYTSVICFGTADILEDADEKAKGLWAICNKYMPEFQEETARRIKEGLKATAVIAIKIEHMTGKQSTTWD